ncbi:ACP S-malonyltransferase [Flocculibacter collagenilyticus]|uniref:ACP S-malonyltransferase n=1 Tax=Flocculibacter collagenilyticus TaxID=2744479 RepID=UPI0018F2FA12|nr:ACP S-malonyltransferase [Flocculibacter collagenilyticus]
MTSTSNDTKKQKVVVICPGRGTYNKEELGYLQRFHSDKQSLLTTIDDYRNTQDQVSVSDLDNSDTFNLRIHSAGENASALIYACAIADFAAINRDKYEIVAVTGNSMGWYISLAAAGALSPQNAIHLINSMGNMVSQPLIGGQMIYPVMTENWQPCDDSETFLATQMSDVQQVDGCQVHLSIKLGGYWVIGGNTQGLNELAKRLPQIDNRYPMKLFNHAAFHTPLLENVSQQAQQLLPVNLFTPPQLPMIDGEGHVWQPYHSDIYSLHHYTLATQVATPYNFTAAITTALKEFAPDKLIILGPGNTLGGAVAQTLIKHQWQNMTNKEDFIDRQTSDPFILAMGHPEQRQLVTS